MSSTNAAGDHVVRASLLTDLLTLALDGLGEDIADARCVLAEDVRIHVQSHGGVGMPEAGGDDVNGDSREQQCGRVQVA